MSQSNYKQPGSPSPIGLVPDLERGQPRSLFFQDSGTPEAFPDSYANYFDSSIRPKFFNYDLYQKQNQDLALKQQRLNRFLIGPQKNLASGKSYADYKYFNSCTADVIPDRISKIFFSPQNIAIVQTAIKGIIKLKTSYVIADQSQSFLITIMLDVFQKHNKSLQYDFLEQVRTLNDIVINQCVQNALLAIQAQDNYFKSLSKIAFLSSNPQATSIKGQNVLEIKHP